MKKLINDVDDFLEQSLRGFADAHSTIVTLHKNPLFISRRTRPPSQKVAVVSGGGSGHEPLHIGFVGHGMLDAACPGNVFTSPTPEQIVAAAKAVDTGAGVVLIVKNYAGDVMNFEMASERLGCEHVIVHVNDDALIGIGSLTSGRRGVAGTAIVEKLVGAAAQAGFDLSACALIGRRVNEQTRSVGVALTSCTVPAVGKPTFSLGEDEIEMGVGIHGEPGRQRMAMLPADAIAARMLRVTLEELRIQQEDRLLLMVNGFGATPLSELHLMYDAAHRWLNAHGIEIARSLVGNYVTSMDMAGCSLTMTKVDNEILWLWDRPIHTAALRWRM